ncbi:hypothetical protein BU16DRAFT_339329 [Lophium mytilinum]|uniref:Uncharacterized protein n=1 Tax=Lophium mytilinum TaxID=390894 RepID=A0A6A6QWT3_9PEZI|nr:hypothetical protein BU16DRAFT_339329 [Lophium mytilinum]
MPFNLLKSRSSKNLQLDPTNVVKKKSEMVRSARSTSSSKPAIASTPSNSAVNELVRSRDEALAEVRKRDETIQQQNETVKDFQKQLETHPSAVQNLQNLTDAFQRQLVTLKDAQQQARDQRAAYEKEQEAHHHSRVSLLTQAQRHKEEVDQLKSRLEIQSALLKRERSVSQANMGLLRQQRDEHEEELRNRHKEVERRLNIELRERETAYNTARKMVTKARVDVDNYRSQLVAAEKRSNELTKELALQVGFFEDEKAVSKALQRELKGCEANALDLAARVHRASEENAELREHCRTALAEVTSLLPFRGETEMLRPQIGQLRDRLRESQRARQELENQLRASTAQNAVITQRFAYVQQVLISSTVEVKELQPVQNQLKSLKKALTGAGTQNKGLKLQVASLEAWNKQAQKALTEREKEVHRMQSDRETVGMLQEQAKTLNEALTGKSGEIERLRHRVEELKTVQEQANALKKALDQSKTEKETLRRDIERLFSL